jgi:hypothetical protein
MGVAAVTPAVTWSLAGLAAFLAATPMASGASVRMATDADNALTCDDALSRIAVDVPDRPF